MAAFQIAFNVDSHRANLEGHAPLLPVAWVMAMEDGRELWRRKAYQVRCLGPSRSEYGWGAERSHQPGLRFGAAFWFFTDHPVEYLDDEGWHREE